MKNSLLVVFLIISAFVKGQNPIVQDFGMADPHIYIFNENGDLMFESLIDITEEDPSLWNLIL